MPTATETLRRDVFPADVLMPDGSVLVGVRALISDRRLLALADKPDGIKVVADVEMTWDAVPASRNTLGGNERLEVPTNEGTVWVNRGRGCGCGSVLKALAPPIPWTP